MRKLLLCVSLALLVVLAGCSNLTLSNDLAANDAAVTIRGNQTGTHDGFYYSFWDDDAGSVTWTLGSEGNYSVSFNTSGNCVGGKGWQTGSNNRIVGYNAGYFDPGSNGYLCLYGWTQNPLVEYYIVEAHGSYTPGGGSQGTVYSDGKSYNLGKTTRYDKPSIIGTATFDQYWSVRNGSTGNDETITFANHVNAWAGKGWNLGSHSYQIMATEGFNSTGGSDVTVWEASSSSSSDNDSSSSSGSNSIVVRARGEAGSEHIQLIVGDSNTVIGDWTLGTSYSDYSASTDLTGGIAVVFDNDSSSGGDVQIDYITVNGSILQAEDQSDNTAVYQNSSCGGSYSEWMHCDGYIGFGTVSGASSSSDSSGDTGSETSNSSGSNSIVIYARGTSGSEHIQLLVGDNSTVVGDWTLGTSYSTYTASTDLTGGIAVVFDNDSASGGDVQIDYITVNGDTRQAEDQATNTGVWQDSNCGGSYSEYLHCDGYIGFGDVSGSSSSDTSTDTSSDDTSGSTGSNSIVVRARGEEGSEHIQLVVGDSGAVIGEWTLGTSYSDYSASTDLSGGIAVVFDNDQSGRDVQIDYITVNGSIRQAEDQSDNTAVYQNSSCGGSYSEWMHCDGYIGFGNIDGSGSSSSTGTATNGYVYLCFDDGPSNSTSPSLVDALVSAGVTQATMFPMGQNISSNSSGMSAYINAGFSIQNHSYSHSDMASWGYAQVYNDLQQANQAIISAGCPAPTAIRLPYLSSSSTIQSVCSALGLTIVNPDVDTRDWNGASTSAIISACDNLQAGGNILAHDGYWTTINAIPSIVSNLQARGLGFAQY